MTELKNTNIIFAVIVFVSAYQLIVESSYAHKFVKKENMELPNHVIKTVESSFVQLCWDECFLLSKCLSVNARKVWDVLFECDLNESNSTNTTLVSKQGTDYYEMTVSLRDYSVYIIKIEFDRDSTIL